MRSFFRDCFWFGGWWIRKNPIKSYVFLLAFWKYLFLLPSALFDKPYAFVIESKEGYLLGARIAADGQWRFPQETEVPQRFKSCIIAYEDRYFKWHPGINPVAIWDAFLANQKAGRVIRGGSTITQQVVRLSRSNPRRTYTEKLLELLWATRLELRYSKDEILNFYATHAPFGGNVVGLQMASYRYFGSQPEQLSWAQAATLAVLPNAPSLVFPGKNQAELKRKRDALLRYLYQQGTIDEMTLTLSLEEPLPQKPHNLPEMAPHAMNRLFFQTKAHKVKTSLDFHLQERINHIVARYHRKYKQNDVHNMAVLVVDVETRKVLAYVGNTPTDKQHNADVDNLRAPRSTGSILKPFLFAEMLNAGAVLPNTLVPDIPTQISGFTPQNNSLSYDGAMPAWKALSRSLNIPSVLMLQKYGVNQFYRNLKDYGLTTLNQKPMHYGLSLILGGAEATLWDLCRAYAAYVGTHNYFHASENLYRSGEFCNLLMIEDEVADFGRAQKIPPLLSSASIHLTFEAMREVNRPEHNESWEYFSSAQPIAWKTGTSYGNRDAWAIGCSQKYVVGIWVGNSNGEGRPEMTGVSYAGAVLFDVFSVLDAAHWFKRPEMDMRVAEVCKKSGFLAGPNCPLSTEWVSQRGLESEVCPYHLLLQLDSTKSYRVHSNCDAVEHIRPTAWFSLPPVMEWYYKKKNADYKPLPPFRSDCQDQSLSPLAFIYPKTGSRVYRARSLEGDLQGVVCKVAHRNPDAELFWYLNDKFLGSTQRFHEYALDAPIGRHVITVVDEQGEDAQCVIWVE